LFKQGHLDQAEQRYHESLRKAPWNLPVLTNLAQIQIKLSKWEEGLDFCDRALALDSNFVKVRSHAVCSGGVVTVLARQRCPARGCSIDFRAA